MDNSQAGVASFFDAWLVQARAHRYVALGLLVALLVVVWLLLGSGIEAFSGENRVFLGYAALGGTAGFGATALGALLAAGLRSVSVRAQDCMLGFAAGMMLAASSFSLILPGLDAAKVILGNGPAGALTVVVGLRSEEHTSELQSL